DLQKNSRLFSQILKMLPGALFVYDLVERRNVYVNQGGWGLLGYSDREVLEMGNGFVERTLHPDDFATLPRMAEQYARMADGEVVAHLFRMKHKNGSWRWVQRQAAVFARTPDGRPQQLIGTASDVTALKTAEEDLRQLSTRLLNAQDQERRRIARQLHDGTAQNIFAVRLNLARLEQQGHLSESAAKILSECQSLCDTSLQEIRTLVYLMHPPMLDQGGLVPAMRWFVDGFSSRSSLSVELVVSPAMERLPAGMERDLFLIVQEALSNVVRHSGSKTAVVRLERHAQEVTLQIIDFGRGMPPGTADPDATHTVGVGIPSMRERLRQNGGRLEIQSGSQGTTVIARVPLQASQVDAQPVT
ncbi:MAG TPA: PAS domain-containing protein, partial [Terriglobia bacterium]|nr:PAS domain-containing protein [Terriglobia bacterium]